MTVAEWLSVPAWKRRYINHLRSPYWALVKAEVHWRSGGWCERKGCLRRAREVHHRTYRHLYDELHHLGDLEHLCRQHHQSEHDRRLLIGWAWRLVYLLGLAWMLKMLGVI